MAIEEERPATGWNRRGPSDCVRLGGEQSEVTPKLLVKVEPDGECLVVSGRLAQTLQLLIRTGKGGFTSGEASPLGWARRTSDSIFKLRRMGIPITTTMEDAGDARIGRYRLAVPVAIIPPTD